MVRCSRTSSCQPALQPPRSSPPEDGDQPARAPSGSRRRGEHWKRKYILSHGCNEHRLPPSRRGLLPHPRPIDKHKALLLLCLSHAARCSIVANFDDAGTGLITRFFMCIVVRCSFLLLGGTAIFANTAVSHRSSAFFYSHKKEFRLASS